MVSAANEANVNPPRLSFGSFLEPSERRESGARDQSSPTATLGTRIATAIVHPAQRWAAHAAAGAALGLGVCVGITAIVHRIDSARTPTGTKALPANVDIEKTAALEQAISSIDLDTVIELGDPTPTQPVTKGAPSRGAARSAPVPRVHAPPRAPMSASYAPTEL